MLRVLLYALFLPYSCGLNLFDSCDVDDDITVLECESKDDGSLYIVPGEFAPRAESVTTIRWKGRLQNSAIRADRLPNLKQIEYDSSAYDQLSTCDHVIDNKMTVTIVERLLSDSSKSTTCPSVGGEQMTEALATSRQTVIEGTTTTTVRITASTKGSTMSQEGLLISVIVLAVTTVVGFVCVCRCFLRKRSLKRQQTDLPRRISSQSTRLSDESLELYSVKVD